MKISNLDIDITHPSTAKQIPAKQKAPGVDKASRALRFRVLDIPN